MGGVVFLLKKMAWTKHIFFANLNLELVQVQVQVQGFFYSALKDSKSYFFNYKQLENAPPGDLCPFPTPLGGQTVTR
jgi:hypothetical protein